LYAPIWVANEGVVWVAAEAVGVLKGWVGEWYVEKGVEVPWGAES
jgi:hypothetical protein